MALVARAQIDQFAVDGGFAEWAGPARCDVRVQSLVHDTVAPRNARTRGSAALFIPGGVGCSGPHPIVAYARGTSTDRTRTMTNLAEPETMLVVAFFAARGYIVVATDYVGYAGSDFAYHPYLDADTEATSVIDSLRAARSALAAAGVAPSGRTFLAGYSQGGHAALAAQRAIERGEATDIALAAVGAMSGPYDLSLTLDRVGGGLLPTLGVDNPDPLQRATLFFADSLFSVVGALANIRLVRDLLERDSVVDFAPRAPLALCGGARDPVVPYDNTVRANAAFRTLGAPPPLVVDVEREPAFARALPPAGTPAGALGRYHNRIVPPLCFQVVRDRLFEPRR